MKLTILIMTVCLLQVSALTKAQITIDAKQESLRNVLKSISHQSGYDFIYSVQDFKNAKPVDLTIKNVSLEKALSAAFYGQPLIYEVADKTVMVKKIEEKSYLETVIARFQTIDVRGKVVDSLGHGLAGATVSVKGGRQSSSTDNNGGFYLKAVEDGSVLLVNYLGYVEKEQTVKKDFNVIVLEESTSKLDEIQIMAYGKTSKRLSTGNIVTIKSDEISRQAINNPLLALQAKVPNLVINPGSGLPGAPISMQLRGQNSLAGARSEPLIMIDGVPFQNTISNSYLQFGNIGSQLSALGFINPNDIESIDVLADADATSIYGSRGGNGVILITTKKGKAGNTQVNADVKSGISMVPQDRNIKLLNTQQYLEMRKEALKNDGVAPQVLNTSASGYAPDLLLWDQNRYTDWQKVLLGEHPQWNTANVSISGGTQAVQFLIAGNYNRQGYVYPILAKTEIKPKDEASGLKFSIGGTSANGKLNIQLGGSYSVNTRQGGGTDFTNFGLTLAPNAPAMLLDNGDLNWELNPNLSTNAATWWNPLAHLRRSAIGKTNTMLANALISYRFSPKLTLKTTAGFTDVMVDQQLIIPISSQDPTTLNLTGGVDYSITRSRSLIVDPQGIYEDMIFNGKLNVLFGGTFSRQLSTENFLNTTGFTNDLQLGDQKSSVTTMARNGNSDYKYLGAFARLNYNIGNEYIFNASLRRDGSSRFGPKDQFGNFWSVGTAWIFTEQSFFKQNLPFVSYGKLRGNYGTSGSDGIGDYGYIDLYSTVFGESNYQGLNPLFTKTYNPYYRWETVKKLEAGIELGFLKDRLLVSAAYWRTRAGNQLGGRTLPATAGSLTVIANSEAKLQNSGWDFMLNSQNLNLKSFSWNTSMNFGIQHNKLLGIPNDFADPGSGIFIVPNSNIQDLVGKPFAGFVYTFDYRGVDPITGIYQFSDAKGNITPTGPNFFAQRVDVIPKTLGITNTLKWKGISFTSDLQLVKQVAHPYYVNDSFQVPGTFESLGQTGNQSIEVLNRWKFPGDVTNIQKFTQTGGVARTAGSYMNRANGSPIYVDASFIKLRSAQLDYQLPNNLLKKVKLRSARIFILGQNLLTITNYEFADPETKNVMVLPMLKTYTLGLSLGL